MSGSTFFHTFLQDNFLIRKKTSLYTAASGASKVGFSIILSGLHQVVRRIYAFQLGLQPIDAAGGDFAS